MFELNDAYAIVFREIDLKTFVMVLLFSMGVWFKSFLSARVYHILTCSGTRQSRVP